MSGLYVLEMRISQGSKSFESKALWHDRERRILQNQYPVNKMFLQAIHAEAQKSKYTGLLTMTCATTISVGVPGISTNLIVRSTCNYKGQPWFDWIVMEWPEQEILESSISSNRRMCFAKVHGFVRYDSNDYTSFRKNIGLMTFKMASLHL